MRARSSPFARRPFSSRVTVLSTASAAHPVGSIYILVLAVLGFLFVLGTALITVTRQDLASTRHITTATQADLAVKSALNLATELIRRKLFDPSGRCLLQGGVLPGGSGPDGAGRPQDSLVGAYQDYPDPTVDEWLSPMEPELLNPMSDYDPLYNPRVLRNVARVGLPLPPPPGGRDFRLAANCRNVPYAPSPDRQLVDADGDGYPDGIWCVLPLGSVGGEQWEAAYKIIDLSGLVNLNTAIRPIRAADETKPLLDASPAELGRYHTGAQPNGFLYEPFIKSLGGDPGEYWNIGPYAPSRSNPPALPTANPQLWHLLGLAINPHGPNAGLNVFGLADELQFRYRGGLLSTPILRQGITPYRSGRANVFTLLETIPRADPGFLLHRYFTASSAVANFMVCPPAYAATEKPADPSGQPSSYSVHSGLLRGEAQTASSNTVIGKSLSGIRPNPAAPPNNSAQSGDYGGRQFRSSIESLVYRICAQARQFDANPDLRPDPMPGFKAYGREIRPDPDFLPTSKVQASSLSGVSPARLQRWWYLKELADIFLVSLDGYLGLESADANPNTGRWSADLFLRADGSASNSPSDSPNYQLEKLRDQHALMAAHLAANCVDYCDADNIPTLFTYIYQNPWSPLADKRKLVRVQGVEHAPLLASVQVKRSGVEGYDSNISQRIASARISNQFTGAGGPKRALDEMVNGDYCEVELFNPYDTPLSVYILPRNQSQNGSVFASTPLAVSPRPGQEFDREWESFRDPNDPTGGRDNRSKRRIFPRTLEFFLADAKSRPPRHHRVYDLAAHTWHDHQAAREDDFALPLFVVGPPGGDLDAPDGTPELIIEPYTTNMNNAAAPKFRLIVPATATLANMCLPRPTVEQVPYVVAEAGDQPLQLRLRLEADDGTESGFNAGPPPDPFVVDNPGGAPARGVYLVHRDNPALWLDALGRDGKFKSRNIPSNPGVPLAPWGENNSAAGCAAIFSPDLGIQLSGADGICEIHMSKPLGKNPSSNAVKLSPTLQIDNRSVRMDQSGQLPNPLSANQTISNAHCSPLSRWFTPVDLNRISTFGGVFKIPKDSSYPADSPAAYMDTWCDRATQAQAATNQVVIDSNSGQFRPPTESEKFYRRRTAGRIDWLRPNRDYTLGDREWREILDQDPSSPGSSVGKGPALRRSGRTAPMPAYLAPTVAEVFYDYDLLSPAQRVFMFLSKYDPHLDLCSNDANPNADVDGARQNYATGEVTFSPDQAKNNPYARLEGTLYGQININTAPRRVLQNLPWTNRLQPWSKEPDRPQLKDLDFRGRDLNHGMAALALADAIMAYRAKAVPREDVKKALDILTGGPVPDRVRRGYGFLSIGELMNLIGAKNPRLDYYENPQYRAYNIDRLGGFSASNTPGARYDHVPQPDLNYQAGNWTGDITATPPLDSVNHTDDRVPGGDRVLFDLIERDLLFRNVSSLITTRSDVFGVYVLVRSRHPATNQVTSVRMVYAIVDRTQVRTLHDTPTVYGPFDNSK